MTETQREKAIVRLAHLIKHPEKRTVEENAPVIVL